MTIHLTTVRQLDLQMPSAPGRPAHLSAASGLVRVGEWLYVVADDELHLGRFPAGGNAGGTLTRLFPGDLPLDAAERKARKPDLEALTFLAGFAGCPHGALLAMGSGSKRHRNQGALLPLDEAGAPFGPPRTIDLTGLHDALGREFRKVNIEGAVVVGDEMHLFQRGRRKSGGSAVVSLDLQTVLDSIANADAVGALPLRVRTYDLGQVDDIPLGFTDGAALPDGRLVFTAVAEDSADSYEDGPCAAAAVGLIGTDGSVEWLHHLQPVTKAEGVEGVIDADRLRLLLVSDADDARVPAQLLAGDVDL